MEIDWEDDIIEKLRAKLDAQIYAAMDAGPLMIGTTTRTSANAANLTAERFNQMVTGANRRGPELRIGHSEPFSLSMTLTPEGQAWAWGLLELRIVEVQPLPTYSQARAHKRRRVNKKWLKRYGLKQTGWNYYLGDRVFFDEKRNVGYCHPEVAARLRYELAQPRIGCKNCNAVIATPTEGQPDPLNRATYDFPPPMVMGGPAGGEYTCDNCGAVNLVARTITGGVIVDLLSVPSV